jgi:hypothetical protein
MSHCTPYPTQQQQKISRKNKESEQRNRKMKDGDKGSKMCGLKVNKIIGRDIVQFL